METARQVVMASEIINYIHTYWHPEEACCLESDICFRWFLYQRKTINQSIYYLKCKITMVHGLNTLYNKIKYNNNRQ